MEKKVLDCDISVGQEYGETSVCKVQNTSSITPILDVAKFCGWDGVKTDKSRKFLADLKQLLTDYNEMPLNYLLEEQQKFIDGDDDVMFVHIREPHEIEKFKNYSDAVQSGASRPSGTPDRFAP